jgi:hypothetical protein
MNEEMALVPIEERKVDFYGDESTAVLVEIDGRQQIYVPVRPISEYLGLAWSAQLQRMRRDEVLAEGLTSVSVMNTQVQQRYDVVCLQLELLPGWLFGISASRVRPDLQAKIKRYRRECYRVLWEAFQVEASAGVVDEVETVPSVSTVALEQIREMGLAIAHMAEQQIEMEQRLTTRLDRAAQVVGDIGRRLSVVERKLRPPALVSDEQAEEISAAVKALAEWLTEKDTRKNHYRVSLPNCTVVLESPVTRISGSSSTSVSCGFSKIGDKPRRKELC